MTSKDAIKNLDAFFPLFRKAYQDAWREVTTKRIEPEYDKRTCSALLHMHAVMCAKRLVSSNPNVIYECIQTRHLFLIKPELAIFRLKQLDEFHTSSNYPTDTSERIYRQQGIPGWELPWLTVGIIPNKDWTDFSGPFVTCPKNADHNNWVLSIANNGPAIDINNLQVDFDDAITVTKTKRFIPKRGANGKEADNAVSGV
jgi:hypothetical protein